MIADRSTVAQIFGVSIDTVRRWVTDGCPAQPPRNPRGTPEERKVTLNTVDVHRWLVQRALRNHW